MAAAWCVCVCVCSCCEQAVENVCFNKRYILLPWVCVRARACVRANSVSCVVCACVRNSRLWCARVFTRVSLGVRVSVSEVVGCAVEANLFTTRSLKTT